MSRKQDYAMLLFYRSGYSMIRNLRFRLFGLPVVRFIVYHDVLPENTQKFREQLDVLKNKTNVVTLDDYLSGNLSTERLNTVITFDDGYASWVTTVLPALNDFGLPATFFVSSGFLGLTEREQLVYANTRLFKKVPLRRMTGCLSETDLGKICDAGHSIGGHTVNHVDLETLSDIDQLKQEITEDKFSLERIAGDRIDCFSYPGGTYKNPHFNVAELLREAGYKAAVSTIHGFNTDLTDRYLLRRDIVDAGMSVSVFKARVYGNYDIVAFLKRLAASFKN